MLGGIGRVVCAGGLASLTLLLGLRCTPSGDHWGGAN